MAEENRGGNHEKVGGEWRNKEKSKEEKVRRKAKNKGEWSTLTSF